MYTSPQKPYSLPIITMTIVLLTLASFTLLMHLARNRVEAVHGLEDSKSFVTGHLIDETAQDVQGNDGG